MEWTLYSYRKEHSMECHSLPILKKYGSRALVLNCSSILLSVLSISITIDYLRCVQLYCTDVL